MFGLTELQSTVLEIVSKHKSDNPVTNLEISRLVKLRPRDAGKEGADLRLVINALRRKGYPICSNDHGYFWAQNNFELVKYIGQLEGRISKIKEACDGLKRAYANIDLKIDGDYVPRVDQNKNIKCYRVKSKSEEGVFYSVTDLITGFDCTCSHFKYFGDCKHIHVVKEKIQNKNKQNQLAMFPDVIMA